MYSDAAPQEGLIELCLPESIAWLQRKPRNAFVMKRLTHETDDHEVAAGKLIGVVSAALCTVRASRQSSAWAAPPARAVERPT